MPTIIEAASLADVGDGLCRAYARMLGNSTAALGLGDSTFAHGCGLALETLRDDIHAATIPEAAEDLLSPAAAMRDGFITNSVWYLLVKRFWRSLGNHIRIRSTADGSARADLEAYLKFLNVDDATKWQCLWDGRLYRSLHYAMRGSYPGVYNCYFEALQGTLDVINHLYSLGMGRFVVSGAGEGTFTGATVEGELIDGGSSIGSIDTTKYCGGVGSLKVSGLTGTGNVTVTGNFYDPATEAVLTAKTSITSVTANGDTVMTVGAGTMPTDGLLTRVTNVSVAAGISAGTIYVEAKRPSGRPLCK